MVNEWAPLIFINGADSAGGRLFSLFHEIIHLWIGENDLYNDRKYSASGIKPAEVICNAAAGELMVPKAVFLEEWNNNTKDDTHEKIKELARMFRCSGSVIARSKLDGVFVRALCESVNSGRTSFTEAYRLTNTTSKTF